MSFCYIGIAKKCTSPANEFLLHACRQTDKRIHIYPPLNKRYIPIISTICSPNKFISIMVMILMVIIMGIMLSGYSDGRQNKIESVNVVIDHSFVVNNHN